MVIKLSLLLLLISCGNEVKVKNNKLESLSRLSPPEVKDYQKSGILTKGDPEQVQFEGKTYLVSVYSSKNALEFIKSLPSQAEVNVFFTGGFQGNQVVLETVSRNEL